MLCSATKWIYQDKNKIVAKQRSLNYRAYFMAEILQFSHHLVWVDETGSDARSHIRKFGYSVRGIPPFCDRIVIHGKRVSAIAAISNEELVGVELTYSTVTGERFADFIRGTLTPEMTPFDGSPKKSVIIMDNCTINHTAAIKELLLDVGNLVFFLPPYSPDLNPIEEAFSSVKYYLKQHDELLQSITNPFPVIYSAFNSITPEKCNGWITHSGY